MKKILFTMALAAIAMICDAQLVVDSVGHVGIGTQTPWTRPLLSVGNHGGVDLNATIQCSDQGRLYGTYVMNHSNEEYEIYGIFANVANTMASSIGGRAESWGCNDTIPPFRAIGMVGAAGRARSAAGILGRRVMTNDISVNYAGIYGSVYSANSIAFGNYSGIYAGFFNGMVRVTDGIYATLLSPAASASPSGQGGLTILSDRCENVTDRLSQVQTLQILRQGFTKAEFEKVEEEEEEEIKSHLSSIQYGLDAEQLKAVYPELVYEDTNGNVSINYVEMVPLLVQSIKELKKELAELKGTSPKNAKAISETTAIEETASDIDMVRMDQNKPNPFSESTVISLNIPEKTQTASIVIYDMIGKQVQSLPVTERGVTDITVYARDLNAGMYIYTLIVDGKVKKTRKMVVTLS